MHWNKWTASPGIGGRHGRNTHLRFRQQNTCLVVTRDQGQRMEVKGQRCCGQVVVQQRGLSNLARARENRYIAGLDAVLKWLISAFEQDASTVRSRLPLPVGNVAMHAKDGNAH